MTTLFSKKVSLLLGSSLCLLLSGCGLSGSPLTERTGPAPNQAHVLQLPRQNQIPRPAQPPTESPWSDYPKSLPQVTVLQKNTKAP